MDRLVSVISQKQCAWEGFVVRVIGDNLAIRNNPGDCIRTYPALEHTLEGMAGEMQSFTVHTISLAVYRSEGTLHAIRLFVIYRTACLAQEFNPPYKTSGGLPDFRDGAQLILHRPVAFHSGKENTKVQSIRTNMANVKQGNLTKPPQWWKHLKEWKRIFWKAERKEQKRALKDENK